MVQRLGNSVFMLPICLWVPMGQTTVACAAQSGNSSCIVDILGPFFHCQSANPFFQYIPKRKCSINIYIYIYIYNTQINWKVEQAAVKKIKSFPQHRTDVSVLCFTSGGTRQMQRVWILTTTTTCGQTDRLWWTPLGIVFPPKCDKCEEQEPPLICSFLSWFPRLSLFSTKISANSSLL